MQAIYDIELTDDFVADVVAIFDDMDTFHRAFDGFGFYLARLPRGTNTWDLSDDGSLRLAWLQPGKLSTGEDIPGIYFSFQLSMGGTTTLQLLRAYRTDDPAVPAH